MASSFSGHPCGHSSCVSGSSLLIFNLLWPLRRRNSIVLTLLFLLLCHGRKPKSCLLVTAMFVDVDFSLVKVICL